eukprot:Skav218889  [mRNA]  locus=scaffold328:88555:106587:+ [translate_table: standard]
MRLPLNRGHSRLEIIAPKVEKNTPQAIMSAEGDKTSFDYNALMHTLKEIGWLIATGSSARAVEQSKLRKRYPEAEALGICKPPKSRSMPSGEPWSETERAVQLHDLSAVPEVTGTLATRGRGGWDGNPTGWLSAGGCRAGTDDQPSWFLDD